MTMTCPISTNKYLKGEAEGMNNSIRLKFQCNILLLPIRIIALFLTVAMINQFPLKTTLKFTLMIVTLTAEGVDLIEVQQRKDSKLINNLLETLY